MISFLSITTTIFPSIGLTWNWLLRINCKHSKAREKYRISWFCETFNTKQGVFNRLIWSKWQDSKEKNKWGRAVRGRKSWKTSDRENIGGTRSVDLMQLASKLDTSKSFPFWFETLNLSLQFPISSNSFSILFALLDTLLNLSISFLVNFSCSWSDNKNGLLLHNVNVIQSLMSPPYATRKQDSLLLGDEELMHKKKVVKQSETFFQK